ncbi:choice-of-anchor D domain-containing protein [Luteolibacter flavescens]|uniref:Choice-of-anchor D domain-containing protein n=1 Tax=Luteolibacter flavescens TaxID=1859460 RepID=A0ABT3FM03_9BACT|nr:LamG-like jellyroll fold domain-containing protein [Luteolibacter flavescens]MCW1884615.1 choice-of-anchor D domain-containing protein [Luteolibacter flavescens]
MKKTPLKTHGLAVALLVAAQGPSQAELVARWGMNEMTGNISDTSGNQLTGRPTAVSLANNGLTYGQPSVTEGTYGAITVTAADVAKFGTSIQFNRAGSGMFQIGSPAVIGNLAGPGKTGTFTLMCWVNANITANSNQRIFSTGPANGWGVGLSNADKALFTTFGVVDMRSTTAVSANNVWQHVAYVWNAGAVEVFINGNSVYTATSANFNDETVTQYGIGANSNNIDPFNGRIDDLKIFNTAMTQSQIVAAAIPGPEITTAAVNSFTNDGRSQVFSVLVSNAAVSGDLTVTSVTPVGQNADLFSVVDFSETLIPGENGTVELGFDPPEGSGTYLVTLQIASNDPQQPVRLVPVTVVVVDPVISAATPRVDFGDLAANPGPQTMTLTLNNDGGGTPLYFSGATFAGQGGNGFSVVSSPDQIDPGESGDVVISFDPGTATGAFGDLLKIETNAGNAGILHVPVLANVALSAATKPVTMVNGNFDAGLWNSNIGTAPQGWTNSLATPPANGLYGQAGNLTPGLTSIAAHSQSVAGYYEQNLTTGNAGLTAGEVDSITVSLDRFYRNDAFTNGHALLRVSLWDKTNNLEITGRDIVFENPGVASGGNILTPVSLDLPYDSSTYGSEEIALRFTRIAPFVVNANANQATLVIDNVSVSVDGTWAPAAGYASWAVSMGLDGTPGKESGPADDPDHDGVSNFDEYAFGGHPLAGGSGVIQAVSATDTNGDSQRELILTVAVREDAVFTGTTSPVGTAAGVSYAIQGSLDLVDFVAAVEGPLAAAVVPVSLPASPPAGYKYVSFRLAGSGGLPGKGFLRAAATVN